MEEDTKHFQNTASQLGNSFHLDMAMDDNVFDLSKKRKLQAEQLDLPISKHSCWDRRFFPKSPSIAEDIEETEESMTNESADRQDIDDDGSDPESAKDSNSFIEDSCPTSSANDRVKVETEVTKVWPPDRPSTSTFDWGGSSFKEDQETLEEFETHLGCPYSEYGKDNSVEPYKDEELDEFLYSNGINSNMYVLSSGRWNVAQDTQSSTSRKPTIDQEFEEYFSTLML